MSNIYPFPARSRPREVRLSRAQADWIFLVKRLEAARELEALDPSPENRAAVLRLRMKLLDAEDAQIIEGTDPEPAA